MLYSCVISRAVREWPREPPMHHLNHANTGVAIGLAAGLLASQEGAQAGPPSSPELAQFRDIYRELVEINTTDSGGDPIRSAEAMAARLRQAGLPAADIRVLSSGPRKGNMVARLRGTGARRPLLVIAHMDVVEAKREAW